MRKLILSILVSTMSFCAFSQGYILLKQKSLSEEISPDFTYTLSGGPTSIANKVLSDRPDAFRRIYDLGGDADGGLFAIASTGITAGTPNPGTIYYRAAGSAEWVSTGSQAFAVDGGAGGSFVAIARAAGDPANAGSMILYRPDPTGTVDDISGNLDGKKIVDVSHSYDDWIYAVTNETDNNLYRRPASGGDWTSIPGISYVLKIDAIPGTDQLFVMRRTAGIPGTNAATVQIVQANNDGSGLQTWASGKSLSAGDYNGNRFSLAATSGPDGNLRLIEQTTGASGANIYYYTAPNTLTSESTVYATTSLTASGNQNQMSYLVLYADQATLPHRIFLRSPAGDYIDDERVQTTGKSNTVTIPVEPGTYTIAQTPVSGWHISGIKLQESKTANSPAPGVSQTFTVTVEEGEYVFVEMENQLTRVTTLGSACGETGFIENFNSYVQDSHGKALEGLTSFHKATSGNFGFGYYAVMTRTLSSDGGPLNYGEAIRDHTGDATAGMLVVDATFEKGTFYRRRFTDLVPEARYSFSAWFNNFNPTAPVKPNISFEIYNAATGALITSANTSDILVSGWKNSAFDFVPGVTDIELVLRNNAPGTAGNDLAIDDISFSYSPPVPDFRLTYCDPDVNGVKLEVTAPLAIGNGYEYSIDNRNWQTDLVFSGLSKGNYTLYVRYAGQAGCASTKEVVVGADNCIALSGSVWHDKDKDTEFGTGEKPVSGDPGNNNGGNSSVTGGEIHANLVGADGGVIISIRVDAGGTYSFGKVESGKAYKIILTTAAQSRGTHLSTGEIPDDWESTGTNDPKNNKAPDNKSNVIDLGTVNESLENINFGLYTDPGLPVKLIRFEIQNEWNAASLSWSTAGELNNSGFEIERSHNATAWTKIGFVTSKSPDQEATGRLDYDYTDPAPLRGLSYYRLKQLDHDGQFDYSPVRSFRINKEGREMTVYPNPAGSGKLMLDIAGQGTYQAEVYNLTGIRVLQRSLQHSRELNIDGLAKGMYVLRVISEHGDVQTSKFVIK